MIRDNDCPSLKNHKKNLFSAKPKKNKTVYLQCHLNIKDLVSLSATHIVKYYSYIC